MFYWPRAISTLLIQYCAHISFSLLTIRAFNQDLLQIHRLYKKMHIFGLPVLLYVFLDFKANPFVNLRLKRAYFHLPLEKVDIL